MAEDDLQPSRGDGGFYTDGGPGQILELRSVSCSCVGPTRPIGTTSTEGRRHGKGTAMPFSPAVRHATVADQLQHRAKAELAKIGGWDAVLACVGPG